MVDYFCIYPFDQRTLTQLVQANPEGAKLAHFRTYLKYGYDFKLVLTKLRELTKKCRNKSHFVKTKLPRNLKAEKCVAAFYTFSQKYVDQFLIILKKNYFIL